MKASDILPEGFELPYRTTSERLQMGAKIGLHYLKKVEEFLADLYKTGMMDSVRKEILGQTSDPFTIRALTHSLGPGISASPPGFNFQLRMIGETFQEKVLDDPNNQHLFQNLVQTMYMHTVWAKYGMNAFNLTDGLVSGLLLTEPLPLTEEHFQLPFPCFAIVIPPGYIPFSYRTDKTEWAQIIWVHRFSSVEKDFPIYQITAECNGKQLYWREPLEKLNRTKCDSQHLVFDDDPAMNSGDDITMTAVMRIVRNLIAWINAVGLPKDEVHKGRRKKVSKHDPKDYAVPMTWILGREVKYGPEIRQAAKDAVQSLDKQRPPKDWKVRMRYIVRGHFRNQAYGPQHSERRRQWVNPFWKGPEGAAAFAHMYEPREPEPKE